MKVSELIELLQKCDPDAEVETAYKSDETTSGSSVNSVAQFMFFGDGEDGKAFIVVQIQN